MKKETLIFEEAIKQPIPPLPGVAGWKEIPLKPNKELLVPLGPFSDSHKIYTNSIYAGERYSSPYLMQPIGGSLTTMFVRESVAGQLLQAQQSLPETYHLVVFDAYRTLEVQRSAFDDYLAQLREKHPEWDEEQLLMETQKYVSIPSKNPTRPSPHNTGGAVDLAIFQLPPAADQTMKAIDARLSKIGDDDKQWQEAFALEMRRVGLINQHAKLLEFGTRFDHGGIEASLDYYEIKEGKKALNLLEIEPRNNRRFLYRLMQKIGLEPYADEWWHYNSRKSQMGARAASLPFAEFGAMELSVENLQHELMRKGHRRGVIRFAEGTIQEPKVNTLWQEYAVVAQSVAKTGDWRETRFPLAAVIRP